MKREPAPDTVIVPDEPELSAAVDEPLVDSRPPPVILTVPVPKTPARSELAAKVPPFTFSVPLWPRLLPSLTAPAVAPAAFTVAGFGEPALLIFTAVAEPGTAAGFQFPVENQSAETVPSQSAAPAGVTPKMAVEAKRKQRTLRAGTGFPAPCTPPTDFATCRPVFPRTEGPCQRRICRALFK